MMEFGQLHHIEYYVKDLSQYVGQTLECKIINVDDRKKRLILSSRKIKSNANFVQFYRNEIGSIRDLIKDEPKAATAAFLSAADVDHADVGCPLSGSESEYANFRFGSTVEARPGHLQTSPCVRFVDGNP